LTRSLVPLRNNWRGSVFAILASLVLVLLATGLARAQKAEIDLSADEIAWLVDHPKIRVHNESNWPPFNFARDGQAMGYSIDFMNLLAERVGLEAEYVTGPSWNDFLEMMKRRELDVMLNIVKTPERLKYLLYTPPYANNPNTT
jgi:ABC-type amino acid transport substrate-binding protein